MCSTWATPPHKKLWPKLHTSPTPPPAAAFFKPCPSTQLTTARPTSSRRRKHLANTTKLTSLVEENSPLTNEAPNPQGTSDKPFEWTKWWYAAVLLEDLEPKRPTPVKILGRDLVLWRDVDKQWRCFEDACPHRLAPLSEGRIEPSDGSLMCSYHGWRFQSDGTCTRIPQAKDGGASTGCKNPRSKAQAYPVMVDRGIVWIWPDDSPTAFIDCTMSKPNGPEFDPRHVSVYMRDVPYPLDALIENVIDASHIPYAHHGYQGTRDAAPTMEIRPANSIHDPMSLDFKVDSEFMPGTPAGAKRRTMKFWVPDLVAHSFLSEADGSVAWTVNVHGTPTTSTTCRAFAYGTRAKTTRSIVASLSSMLMRKMGIDHIFLHNIFDGDALCVNPQSRNLRAAEESGKSWKSKYFMPHSTDIPISSFRRWIDGKAGGGGPRLKNGDFLLTNDFEARSRYDLLERFNSHTRHCKKCLRSLFIMRTLKSFATILSLGCIACAAFTVNLASAGMKISNLSLFSALAGTLLFAFLRHKLVVFESLYYYKEYEYWKT